MPTREQVRAQIAHTRVAAHHKPEEEMRKHEADYKRFCQRFPALIQTCGLAQAIAFAEAKGQEGFLEDLACVVGDCNAKTLATHAREFGLSQYQKLSRDTMKAATWLKRYAEALLEGGK